MDGLRIISCQSKMAVAVVFIGWILFSASIMADDEAESVVKKAKEQPTAATKKAPADAKPAAEKDKPADADKEKKPPANPLTKFIRNIFGGKKPQPKPPVGQLIPGQAPVAKKPVGNGDTTARDHIDTRAPYDTQQASRLRKADSLIRSGQYKQAAEWLQRVLDKVDDIDDSVIRLPNGRLVSVSSQANRLLGQFPAEALQNYRQQHGDLAKQLLVDALRTGDTTSLAAVADKYFHTEAGHDAANYLGSQHIDRGEFGPAARRFLQLLEANAPVTRSSQWKLKAAVVFQKAGMADGLKQLREQLSGAEAGSLEIGGRAVDPNAWIDSLGDVGQLTIPQLNEWRMLYGSPQRTGVAIGGDPLLLQRWNAPLTHNRRITEQVQILLEDLADQNRTAISAWHPLSVGNKVIFRTMRGVQVVDADTGKPLWETRAGVSPERLLTGQPAQQTRYSQGLNPFGRVRFNNGILSNYRSNAVDNHPLTSLLFRDATFGMLSSQDNKLFVIEDHAVLSQQQPGYYSSSSQSQNDPYRRDWSSNKLTAYNLDDGRPEWEIGGRDTKESIQLPLAGTYFFGAPTPAGRELYAVGEKDNEIRLYSLDPETGLPLWSQLLAVSEARIEQDLGRRWWNAQVAVSGGVIVCPTTVGWLVAIDRTSHNILWTHRYSTRSKTRNRNFGGRQVAVVPNSQYGMRWCPSAPVIVGDRVVYTPSEYTDLNASRSSNQANAAAIICLNLSNGNKLWQKPKGTNRYLAGVFDDRPVLVGKNTVSALSLEKGTVVWNRPIPTTDGQPTGFGVAVGNRYHLPLNSGQLWTIDLKNGQVARKSYLADTPGQLGNLTMHRGLLLSLSPLGLTSFEQRDAILTEIRQRKERNPRDAWALQREADIAMLNREYEQAIQSMRMISADQVAAEQLPHYRQQMIACLTSLIRSDFANRQNEVFELVKFAQHPDEKLQASRLTAEQHESMKQYQAAFAIYRSLATADGRRLIDRSGKTRVTLPLDRWLAGRMGDLWQQMDNDARQQEGQHIADLATNVGDDIAALEQIATLYDFHPIGRPARLRLSDLYAQRGELASAQHHLMHLMNSQDEQVAANAIHRLAQLMQKRKLSADADYYFKQLATRHAEVEVAEGTTAKALYEKLRKEGLISANDDAGRPSWGEFDLKMEQTGATYSSSQQYELKSGEFRLPYFRQFRFEINQQQKLSVVNLANGKLHWLVPLRGKSRSSQSFPVAQAVGHRLYVLYRDVLHCLSPVDRRVLWTRALETRGQANGYYYNANQQNTRPMQSGQSILSGQSLIQQNTKTGMLAVANSSYICIYGRRKFTVLDSATGDIRWSRNHVPAYTKIVGNEDVLYMVQRNNEEASVAFRATDGKLLAAENVRTLMAKAIRISERGLVLVESRSGSSVLGLSSSAATAVRQYDPIIKKEHWSHSFPSGAYFSLLDGDTLAVLRKDGTFAILDLENGQISELGKLLNNEGKTRSGLYVVADRDNIYLIANKSRRSGSYYSLGLPFVRVNGDVYAFDRKQGKRLWKQSVTNQNLVLSQFEHSPVMTFAMRTYVRKGQLNYWTLNVVAFDKLTGRKLVESKSPFNSSFRSFNINMADRYIELRSYNNRIRLVAIDRKMEKLSTPASGD